MTDFLLRAIGLFYIVAGVIGWRAAMMAGFLDRAIAAIELKPVARGTRLRQIWLTSGAVLVGLGGLALVLLSEWAAWLFVAAALQQAFYLVHVAPVHCDPDDPPDPAGRRSTRNAFLIYLVATVVVLAAFADGRLRPLAAVPAAEWTAIGVFAAALALSLAWPRLKERFRPARGPAIDDGDLEPGEPSPPSGPPTALSVMADYGCHPIWWIDGPGGNVDPAELGLSGGLVADLADWAQQFEGAIDPDDPGGPGGWSEAEYAAHEEAGRRLAVRVARELAAAGTDGIEVHVYRNADGHIRVSASDPL